MRSGRPLVELLVLLVLALDGEFGAVAVDHASAERGAQPAAGHHERGNMLRELRRAATRLAYRAVGGDDFREVWRSAEALHMALSRSPQASRLVQTWVDDLLNVARAHVADHIAEILTVLLEQDPQLLRMLDHLFTATRANALLSQAVNRGNIGRLAIMAFHSPNFKPNLTPPAPPPTSPPPTHPAASAAALALPLPANPQQGRDDDCTTCQWESTYPPQLAAGSCPPYCLYATGVAPSADVPSAGTAAVGRKPVRTHEAAGRKRSSNNGSGSRHAGDSGLVALLQVPEPVALVESVDAATTSPAGAEVPVDEVEAVSESADDCGAGEEWDGYECTECEDGYYKMEAGPGLCIACAGCDIGQERLGCGRTEEGKCEECKVGYFNPEQSKNFSDPVRILESVCQECEWCDDGHYREGCGLALEGTCVPCLTQGECDGLSPPHFTVECEKLMDGWCEPCKTTEKECYTAATATDDNVHQKPSAMAAKVHGLLEDASGGYTIPTHVEGPPLPDWVSAADPHLPWFMSHLKMRIKPNEECETQGNDGGACVRCMRCALWLNIWLPGECGPNHDKECFSSILECGTQQHSLVTWVLIIIFAVYNINKVLRAILSHLKELAQDVLMQGVTLSKFLIVLGAGSTLIALADRIAAALPEDMRKNYPSNETAAGSRGIKNLKGFVTSKLEHLTDFEDAFDNTEEIHWITIVFMTFTAFFFYCVIRLWITDLLNDLCDQWKSKKWYISFLILQIVVIFETSCIMSFSILEDLAGIYWFCVSLFVFGRAMVRGGGVHYQTGGQSTEEGAKCFVNLVLPRFFLIILAHFIPFAASITLNYGRYNVVVKFLALSGLLLLFALMRKLKDAIMGKYCDRGGPACVSCGHWRPYDDGAQGRRGGQSLRKEITCELPPEYEGKKGNKGDLVALNKFATKDRLDLAVCKCTKSSSKVPGMGSVGKDQFCDDLVGEKSPCYWEGCDQKCAASGISGMLKSKK